MRNRMLAAFARVAMVVLTVTLWAGMARAQAPALAQPSPASIALAKELIELKGSANLYGPVVDGVIEQSKGLFLQTNPGLVKDLTEVAAALHTEYAARRGELGTEVARLYAARFTEQELKDELAFFKTPLGKKIIIDEPKILDESFNYTQQWANKFSEEVLARFRADMKKRGHDL